MSYDLRDLEGEVRRLADTIGNMVRQIQIERRENAIDAAAARVTAERVAGALESLATLAGEGAMGGGGGGIMESALGATIGSVFSKIMSHGCDDPDCPGCAEKSAKKSDADVDADEGDEPINGKGEELAK